MLKLKENKVFILLAALAVTLLWAAFSYYQKEHDELELKTGRELAVIADLKISQINQWLAERYADALTAANTPAIQQSVRTFASNPSDPRAKSEVQGWLQTLHSSYLYSSVALYDHEGKLLLEHPAGTAPQDAMIRGYLHTAVRDRQTVTTDIQRDSISGAPRWSLLQPISASAGEPSAVLLLQRNLQGFLYPLLQSWPGTSPSAETLLLRREGEEVVYLNELRHKKNTALTLRIPISKGTNYIYTLAAGGMTGHLSGLDYRDIPVVATIRPVPGTPWIMVSKIDHEEINAPLRQEAYQITLAVLTSLLALVAIGLWWWREQKTGLLVQRLAAEEALRKKDKRLVSLMQETNDIILVLNEELRVVEFNEKALEVYGYRAEEMQGLPVQAFRPADHLPSQAENLKQFQSPEGASYETIHQRKDGTTFPVDIGGRAVRTNGHFEIIAVIRDITQRKQHEAHIQRLNRLYAALSGVNQAIVQTTAADRLFADVCQILLDKGGFKLVWIGLVDVETKLIRPVAVEGDATSYTTGIKISVDDRPEGRGPSGTALRENRTFVCNDFLGDPNTLPWREAAQRAGIKSSIALPLRQEGKVIGALTVYAGEMNAFGADEIELLEEAAGDISFSLDNLAREAAAKRAQQALREREEVLAAIFEQAMDAIALVDAVTGRFVEFNKAAHLTRGYSHEEFAGLTVADIQAEFSAEQVQTKFAQVLAAPSGLAFETTHRNKSGELRNVVVNSRGLKLKGKTFLSVMWTDITERKRAEQVLRQSEERFRRLFDLAPVPLAMSDQQGMVTYVNAQATRLFGYSRADIPTLEDWWAKAYPDAAYRQEMAESWQQRLQKARELKRPVEPMECQVTCKDGQERTVEISAIELAQETLVTFFDLTQRRETEEALLQEQEFTLALLENLDAGVVACGANGKLRLFNRAAREWHGLGPTDVSQEHWAGRYDLYESDGETPMNLQSVPLSRAMRQEKVRGARMVIMAKGQPPRHIIANASPVMSANGRQLGAVAVMHDITEQLKSQAQMQLQSTALNAAANVIVITDKSGDIVWANEAFTRHTGYTLEEALGHNPRMLKSGVQSKEFYEQLWATVTAGQVWHGELRNRRKDGALFDEEMTITPVRSATGKITHFVAIKQDITERRNLEKQYLRAQRMEGVGLLAGGIAHDLNNVLAPILMSAELLRYNDLPPEVLNIIDTMEASAKRGADIVKQVLTFARGIEGEKGPVQLRHLIKDMVRMASETFPRNIHIKTRVTGDLHSIKGDATQLHQVLLNLGVNARDAMPAGGELIFSASNVHLMESDLRAHPSLKPGEYVKLEVSDTGTGIPPEVMERIFDPFFTTKEQGKGTGLGLATVMGIVRGHGGAIEVESTPGHGTKFIVILPALPAGSGGDAHKEKAALPQGRNELVLLVDDEPGILMIGETLLKRSGYRVLTATNGVDALAVFLQQRQEIKLVITDIMMPTMDGVALVTQLRRLKPEIKCIAASGLMGTQDQMRVEELKANGVRHFLTKPFTVEALLGALDEELH